VTSVPSRDDVEAELWRAGVRSSYIMSRLMTVIDSYVFAQIRSHHPLEDAPQGPFAYLRPGESDMDQRVTRCSKCAHPKAWSHFGMDRTSPTGHKKTCKSCLRIRVRTAEQQWKCPYCKEKKPPGEFPPEKHKNPRVRVSCNTCTEKLPSS
jgi:hypothetical protein